MFLQHTRCAAFVWTKEQFDRKKIVWFWKVKIFLTARSCFIFEKKSTFLTAKKLLVFEKKTANWQRKSYCILTGKMNLKHLQNNTLTTAERTTSGLAQAAVYARPKNFINFAFLSLVRLLVSRRLTPSRHSLAATLDSASSWNTLTLISTKDYKLWS